MVLQKKTEMEILECTVSLREAQSWSASPKSAVVRLAEDEWPPPGKYAHKWIINFIFNQPRTGTFGHNAELFFFLPGTDYPCMQI